MSPEQTDDRRLEREMERAERFRRVATRRTNTALKLLAALIRTADRRRYHYSERQVEVIITTLRQAIDKLEAAYAGKTDDQLRVEL